MTENMTDIFEGTDVAQLECHFKWFKELDNRFSGQWLSLLLDKKLHNDLKSKIDVSGINSDEHDVAEDPHDETIEDENHKSNGIFRLALISWHCTLILRNTFEKNFAEAFQISNELLTMENAENCFQSQVHFDTFSYIMLANQLNILKEWRLSGDCTVDQNDIVGISIRIESLKSVVDSNVSKAFINTVKSNLSKDLQASKLRIDFAMTATELDPKCATWHQNLYSALRYHRRSQNYCQQPSRLEISACEEAYKLGSGEHGSENILIGATIQMAKLYAELLFDCQNGSDEHQKMTELAIKFAREAVHLKPHSKRLKMRLASLLTGQQICRRNRNDGREEALELVRECEVGANCSEICHKLGKYYNNRHVIGYDTAKALKWFEKGLEAHSGNFPCFADMLRNPNFRVKPTAEILQQIDNMLSAQSKRTYKAQLNFIKGFFLWNDDREAAVQSWLMAMEESFDLNINFIWLAIGNFCFIKDQVLSIADNQKRLEALKMMNNVKFFMSRRERLDDQVFTKLKDVINSVIKELDAQQLQQRGTHHNTRNHAHHSRNNGVNRNWRN